MSAGDARLLIWRACGGPIDEVMTLVDVLVGAELVAREHTAFRLTKAGRTALAKRSNEGHRAVALALLRAGYLHDQARVLLDVGSLGADKYLRCSAKAARRRCPQLVGILQNWPNVKTSPSLVVPPDLVAELETVWALLPPTSPNEVSADAIRKSVGNRGELYSYQYERMVAGSPSHIVWVARDDQNLGYDIEDRSSRRRRIEVKASGDRAVRFLMSDNEWRKAHDDPSTYEVHFWGGIDLARDPAEEYSELRSQGYPVVFSDLPRYLADGELKAAPTKWRVERVVSV